MSADVAVRDVTAASRSAEAAATLPATRWEYRHVAVIRIGSSAMRLARLTPMLANLVSHPRRADDGEVNQEVSVNGHWSSIVMPGLLPIYAWRRKKGSGVIS
jgi:hypothetical protein